MNIDGRPFRTIWVHPDNSNIICIIDQTKLPFRLVIKELTHAEGALAAIANMEVRGAGLIGVTAAFAMYLAGLHAGHENFKKELTTFAERLKNTRPTAVNLQWAVNQQIDIVDRAANFESCVAGLFENANQLADEDADMCKNIGEHGLPIIREISRKKDGEVVNVLTHCNAGWLAFVDYGSATAPIYAAHDAGIKIHVWVDETRPRNQGARLTAWELAQHGVPHTVIADNTGGHLMQHGLVDLVITGADRVTRNGDAANKIGTYLKALAAKDNRVPFYVALPSSTIDWQMIDGLKNIPIEQRSDREVKYISGWHDGEEQEVRLLPEQSPAENFGFDVTPARLISGLITERGICEATESAIKKLFD